MRLASVYYNGMFTTDVITINGKEVYKHQLRGCSDLEKFIIPFMDKHDCLSNEVVYKSQIYKKGDLVVLQCYNPHQFKVGLVHTMLVRKDLLYFVCDEFISNRTQLRYFKAQSDGCRFSFSNANSLIDYKPLLNHGTSKNIYFVLNHHISYNFD